MESCYELSQFILEDRKKNGMSQSEYADLIGISRPKLSQLELGQPPGPNVIKKLELFYEKPLSELLGEQKINALANLETTKAIIVSLLENKVITDVENIDSSVKNILFDVLKREIVIIKEQLEKSNK